MICTTLDDFIRDKDKTYWKVQLSDGTFVYQDDDREEYEQKISWFRLKDYCNKHGLFVKKMWITFRSHTEYIGESDKGFFFSFGLLARPFTANEHRYICGPIVGDNIHIQVWKVPELLKQEDEIRPVAGNEEKIICINH